MKFKLFVFAVLLAVMMAFVYQNSVPVTVRFFNWEYGLSFSLLLMAVLGVGVLLGMLLVLRRQSYNKKKKAAKEAAQHQQAAAKTDAAGDNDQDSQIKPQQQETPLTAGEDHESNNTDNWSDSRVR
ncbi:lipopolysaccharide assembly protein LapA domain-containing protein [Pelovirga terrestris]|uniref:DUF1049 domain-containing protein n=1 Tax=Pelovirga terrestris TaxID=2771352 RepID=A0A8J6UIE9_9BACT|nr:lipopolysaccharide assembly protein LapA domain-containing protein [Pelovirga terrestris]MBD1400800.1 DUF1049 domain-containing protein [Pelovirga terrestris]